jgi:NADH:ubiquinone oxidoreductase subunit 3 (subunit A)
VVDSACATDFTISGSPDPRPDGGGHSATGRHPAVEEGASAGGPPRDRCASAAGSDTLLEQYGHLGILLIFAIIFPTIPLVSSWGMQQLKIRPHVPNVVKADTYECGVETEGPTWVQFNFRYYLVALIFVVFAVEVVFLFPLALALDSVSVFGLVAGILFIGVLALGLVYEWRKQALEWR